MNLHKLYLSLFCVFCLLTVVVGAAWRDHVRDDARRDAVLETQKKDIVDLEQSITAARSAAQSQVAEWEQQRKQLATTPSRAPELIRELIPMQTPIQQTSSSANQAVPDAPSAVLSRQQEVDLAQYAVGCKECSIERDQLAQEVKDQQEIVSRQKTELDAAKKAAKGGSLWQRTVRIAKWGAIFGALGYVMGRAQR
jgi:hypothetical protein